MKKKLIRNSAAILAVIISMAFFLNFGPPVENDGKRRTFQKHNKKTGRELSCQEYEYFAWQLNDSVHHYLENSYVNGIKKTLTHPNEINAFVAAGALISIENNALYIIDTLKYSYPFLIPEAKKLLSEISTSFQQKLVNTNLNGTRLIVTSVLRTSTTIKLLRRRNRNAIRHSAHLHGTTFDISYNSFMHTKKLTTAENESLGAILAKTLFELRYQKKCWVTYERYQRCFHIVNRINTQ